MLALILLVALGAGSAAAGKTDVLPTTTLEAAKGKAVVLPEALHGRVGLLVVGFTKGSAEAAKQWTAQLRSQSAHDANAAVLRIAVLESVPGFLRGIVRKAARGQEAPEHLDSFLLLFNSEEAWKKLVRFEPSADRDAYLLVIDRAGRIAWRGHAGEEPQKMERMLGEIRAAVHAVD